MSSSDKPGGPAPKRRARSPHYKKNNEGGYGNPPVRTQYQKRGPGGPGRNKGNNSLEAELRKVYSKLIPLSDGTKVLPTAAIAQKGLTLALKQNSLAAVRYAEAHAMKYGPQGTHLPADITSLLESLSDGELNMASWFIDRWVADADGGPQPEDPEEAAKVVGTYKMFIRPSGHIGIEKIDDDGSF